MFNRRRVLGLLGLAAPAIAFALRAIAQAAFPAKPLHIIVPFQAGGETDIVTRRMVNQLQATRGYTVVVDNFAGAGGDVGTERALREGGDGYTLAVSRPMRRMRPIHTQASTPRHAPKGAGGTLLFALHAHAELMHDRAEDAG